MILSARCKIRTPEIRFFEHPISPHIPQTIVLASSAHRHQYTADTNLYSWLSWYPKRRSHLGCNRTASRLNSTLQGIGVRGGESKPPPSIPWPQSIKSIKSILGCRGGSLGYPEESRNNAPCCQGHGSQISCRCQITRSEWKTGPEVDISSLGRNARNDLGK